MGISTNKGRPHEYYYAMGTSPWVVTKGRNRGHRILYNRNGMGQTCLDLFTQMKYQECINTILLGTTWYNIVYNIQPF